MAIKFLIGLPATAFSPMSKPKDEETVTLNCYKMSLRGVLVCSGTTLVSFIFNRFLAQEGTWKALAPHIFKASLFSYVTFAFFASCIGSKIAKYVKSNLHNTNYDKSFNYAISAFAKKSALAGLMGAASAWAIRFVTPNSLISSFAERLVSPLLGIGIAGATLKIFHYRQTTQLKSNNDKT
jgi:hypothetical protein